MTRRAIVTAALLVAALMSQEADAASVLLNGGFEDGVTSVTAPDGMGGTITNPNVPVDWNPDFNFVINPAVAGVSNLFVNSGSFALRIAVLDSQPAEVGQSFTDVAGARYLVTFSIAYSSDIMDPGAFLRIAVGGSSFTITNPDLSFFSSYRSESISFIGSDFDELTIQAASDPGFWYIDDVSVVQEITAVPLPAALPLFATGIGGFGLLGWRRKRKAQAVAA
jgi:hypothetical protein